MTHADYEPGIVWRCPSCGVEKLVFAPNARIVYCVKSDAHPPGSDAWVEMKRTEPVVAFRRTGRASA